MSLPLNNRREPKTEKELVEALYRKTRFVEVFTDPASEFFDKPRESLVAVGFTEDEIRRIEENAEQWYEEVVGPLRRRRMLRKAELALEKSLNLIDDGDTSLIRVGAESAKYVTSRLGNKFYSERQEVDHTTGGEPIRNITLYDPTINVGTAKEEDDARTVIEVEAPEEAV